MSRNLKLFLGIDRRGFKKLGFSFIVGLLLGLMVVFAPSLPIPPDYQKLVYIFPFFITLIIVFNNPEKLILAAIAIGVPLNLDVSILISPYARNFENISRGYRTLIAITELRVSVVTIALLVGYFLWFIAPGGTKRTPIKLFPATTIPALGLIFFSILSVVQAEDIQLWFFRVEQLVEVFLVYFYLVNHLKSVKEMKFFIIVALFGLLAESMLMIVQWLTGLTFSVAGLEAMLEGPGQRVGGTLGHTGPAAGYLSAMIFIAMAMMWGSKQKPHKWLAAICIGLSVIALVSTGSRIGWGAFALTFPAFLIAALRKGWIKWEILVLVALAVMIFGISLSNVIFSRFSSLLTDNSAQARPMMWKLAWNAIKAHPWLGVGAGNYALVTRDYYTYDVGPETEVYDIIVHNAYLGIWAESGIFALLCYIGVMGAAIYEAWSCVRSQSKLFSLLGIAFALAIVSQCIQMITGTFIMRSITLFLWTLIAVSASLPHLNKNTQDAQIHLIENSN